MITLRTVEIEIGKDPDTLLTNLQWNTEKLKIIPLNLFYFFYKFNISRQWLGQIDRGDRQFKVISIKGQSDFGVRLSSIVCKGEIIQDFGKSFIKIDLQPTGWILFNNVSVTIMTIIGLILIPIETLFDYWWGILIWTLLLISNFTFLITDLNRTEEKLLRYFEKQDVIETLRGS